MHGIVFVSLKEYVLEHYGEDAWDAMVEAVDPESPLYVPLSEYPDEELLGFLSCAVEMTDTDLDVIVRDFGSFIVPRLLDTYGAYADDDWSALELIANTETYIHESLRRRHGSQFTPPELKTGWRDDRTVAIAYESDRRLCELAKGIVEGIGDHYGEPLRVEEHECMKAGDDRCLIQVRRVATADATAASVDATARDEHGADEPRPARADFAKPEE